MCEFSHATGADGHRVKDQLHDAIEQRLVAKATSDAGVKMFGQTTVPDDGVEMHLQVNAPVDEPTLK
jgi:hypothetical protein